MSSRRKLQEAAFFIELLHALQERGSSLTHLEDTAAEASFLYAAILNAFYSVVEVMRKEALRVFQWDPALAALRSSLPQKNRIRIR